MKKKIAQYLLLATLGMVVASYLPWVYLTVTYYILRYAIMACMAACAASGKVRVVALLSK